MHVCVIVDPIAETRSGKGFAKIPGSKLQERIGAILSH
jgi:hypothetical protein